MGQILFASPSAASMLDIQLTTYEESYGHWKRIRRLQQFELRSIGQFSFLSTQLTCKFAFCVRVSENAKILYGEGLVFNWRLEALFTSPSHVSGAPHQDPTGMKTSGPLTGLQCGCLRLPKWNPNTSVRQLAPEKNISDLLQVHAQWQSGQIYQWHLVIRSELTG